MHDVASGGQPYLDRPSRCGALAMNSDQCGKEIEKNNIEAIRVRCQGLGARIQAVASIGWELP